MTILAEDMMLKPFNNFNCCLLSTPRGLSTNSFKGNLIKSNSLFIGYLSSILCLTNKTQSTTYYSKPIY